MWWTGTPTVEQLKSWVRISAAVCMLAVILRALWLHQDAPQMLQRVLAKMEQMERQHTLRWNLLQAQLLDALQTLRDSASRTPAEVLSQGDAAEIAARRERELLTLEKMWQEALAAGHNEVGAWSGGSALVTCPSSAPAPPTPMDAQTPLPRTHMNAKAASRVVNRGPQAGQAAMALGGGVQLDERMNRRAGDRSTAPDSPHRISSQPVVPDTNPHRIEVQQEDPRGGFAGMRQAGGSRKLTVPVLDTAMAASLDDGDGAEQTSPRRSPRSRTGNKRLGEHNGDERQGNRREKKLKAVQ